MQSARWGNRKGSRRRILCLCRHRRVYTGRDSGWYPPLPAFDSARQISGLFSQQDSTYGPSMLIDMEDGRPTEGEHTIGDLVERAVRGGISVPLLTAARCNLQTYEINRRQPN